MGRLTSGFTSLKEVLSYLLGAALLIFAVTGASPDVRLIAAGAGLSLLGAPIVGTMFEKKG